MKAPDGSVKPSGDVRAAGSGPPIVASSVQPRSDKAASVISLIARPMPFVQWANFFQTDLETRRFRASRDSGRR